MSSERQLWKCLSQAHCDWSKVHLWGPITDGKEGKMAVFGTSCYRETYWKNIYTLKTTKL
jgi:hypothetical protein